MKLLSKERLRNLLLIIGIIGPGIITATVDNDAGGITTYSIAGAHFGYSLLWSLVPITILLVIIQEMCARMGAVTGKGLADLIRENFGLRMTMFIMIGLVLGNLFITVAEFAGIAAIAPLFGVNKYLLVSLSAVLVLAFTIKLSYKHLEKFFLLLVFFYVAYVLSGIIVKPDWSLVAKSLLVPSISFSRDYLVLLVGIIGTTITPWMQFYLQSSIVEKGIGKKEYKYSRWDIILGSITTDIVSFFIIVSCAAVLFGAGARINGAVDAAMALKPLAGAYASMLFAAGFFGAALFGAFILPLSTSFYVCEAFGWESGVNKKFSEARAFYLLLILIVLISVGIVFIPNIPLIPLMLLSQVINGLILPIILVVILLLVNNKKVMGDYINPRWLNVVAIAGCVFIFVADVGMIVVSLFANII